MDWKQVIKRNREALAVVIAGLIALAGQWTVDPRVKPEDDGLRNDPIPRSVYRAILRILRPAESALRRLIVIVAATLNASASPLRGSAGRGEARDSTQRDCNSEADRVGVTEGRDSCNSPPPGSVSPCEPIADLPSRGRLGIERPLPDFSSFTRRDRQASFRLIDPRKRFGQARQPTGMNMGIPRISVPGLIDAVRPEKPDDTFNAAALYRRIESLNSALKTLPRQARRLNRLMAQRAKAEPGPGRVGPIRPGHPPGFRKRAVEPVDDILRDCHHLALESGFKPP